MASEGDAGHLLRFDNEGADAVRARTVSGPRHDHDVVGRHAVAAPLLAAVENVGIAVLLGAGAYRCDVGARLRLGNRDRRHDAAFGDDRQEFLALLLGAEVKQRHDEHGVEAGDRRAGRRDLGDFLARDADHRQVAVRAAILFGHPELHQPHFAEQLDDLEREAVGLVDLGGDRRHVLGDHLSDGVAEGQMLFGEAHERVRSSSKQKGLPFNG